MKGIVRIGLVIGLGAALAGCPAIASNQSASTIPVGEFQQGFGVEYVGGMVDSDDSPTGETEFEFLRNPWPNYWIRYGVTDFMDLGVRYSFPFSMTFDAKFQVLDTEMIDIAINPQAQYSFYPVYFHLPILVGLSLGDSFEVVVSPRLTYMSLLNDDFGDDDNVFGVSQLFVGGGLTLIIDIGERFQISPEVVFLQGLDPDLPGRMLSVNMGFAMRTGQSDTVVVVEDPVPAAPAMDVPAGYEAAPPPVAVGVEVAAEPAPAPSVVVEVQP